MVHVHVVHVTVSKVLIREGAIQMEGACGAALIPLPGWHHSGTTVAPTSFPTHHTWPLLTIRQHISTNFDYIFVLIL